MHSIQDATMPLYCYNLITELRGVARAGENLYTSFPKSCLRPIPITSTI